MLTLEKPNIRSCCQPPPPVSETIWTRKFWNDRKSWKSATINTFHCLIGCSIGDFGTIIYLQKYHPEIPILQMMGYAMVMGLITSILFETAILKFRESFRFRDALSTAFNMSFASMIAMELSENATDYWLTGGGIVAMNEIWYWGALGIALIVGFLVPYPYNYYKVKRLGKSCH